MEFIEEVLFQLGLEHGEDGHETGESFLGQLVFFEMFKDVLQSEDYFL